jgi:hypothetical protein
VTSITCNRDGHHASDWDISHGQKRRFTNNPRGLRADFFALLFITLVNPRIFKGLVFVVVRQERKARTSITQGIDSRGTCHGSLQAAVFAEKPSCDGRGPITGSIPTPQAKASVPRSSQILVPDKSRARTPECQVSAFLLAATACFDDFLEAVPRAVEFFTSNFIWTYSRIVGNLPAMAR